MKKTICILITILFIALFSCEKDRNEKMTIVKDCTGYYLRQDGKDYHVCNKERIEAFTDGATVEVTYKKIEVCKGSAMDVNVCEMYHQNEGWIEIERIQQL